MLYSALVVKNLFVVVVESAYIDTSSLLDPLVIPSGIEFSSDAPGLLRFYHLTSVQIEKINLCIYIFSVSHLSRLVNI